MTTCDEVLEPYDEEIKTISTNFNEKKVARKTLFYFPFLITTRLLIVVSIYCYLIKYRAKQKHLLPFHDTKLKQFCFGSINRCKH